ncbi:MAG: hypothetical protein AB7L65_00870 [Hyphomonadaceae bacterium]
MIDAVFLHIAEDAEAARQMTAAWPGQGAVPALIAPDKRLAAFGRQVLVCAIWTGAAEDDSGADALAAALGPARRRGVILLWPGREAPAALAQNGAPVLEATDGAAGDGARLHAIALDMDQGRFLPMGGAPAAKATRAPRVVKKRDAALSPAPARREPRRISIGEGPSLAAVRSRKHLTGFAIGVGIGAALFFGLLAPRISGWLGLAQADRAPPPLLAARPPSAAAATPAAPAAPAAAPSPAAQAAPVPLRGLTEPAPHPGAAPESGTVPE